jgi:hypothetical protein
LTNCLDRPSTLRISSNKSLLVISISRNYKNNLLYIKKAL